VYQKITEVGDRGKETLGNSKKLLPYGETKKIVVRGEKEKAIWGSKAPKFWSLKTVKIRIETPRGSRQGGEPNKGGMTNALQLLEQRPVLQKSVWGGLV